MLRFPTVLALFTAASILSSIQKSPPRAVETPGGTIAMYNDAPVLGWGSQVWRLESDHCWRVITEISDSSAKIQALLQEDDDLLIGTDRDGLMIFDGEATVRDRRDYLFGSQDNPLIYAITRISSQQILIGTAGYSPKPDGINSGLWTWDFAYDPPIWRANLDLSFPSGVTVKTITVDTHSTPQTVYAGTSLHGVYSMGSDGTWNRMAEGLRKNGSSVLFGADFQQIVVSPSVNYHVVYAAATSGYEFSSGIFRIFPDQEGAVWEQLANDQLSSSDGVWAVVADPVPSRPLGVWIGTDRGLFYSANAGDEWILNNISPQQPQIQAIFPFQDSLIVLTENTVLTAGIAESRKSSPQWIKYAKVSDEQRCLSGPAATVQSGSATASPTPTVTPVLTPVAAASATVPGFGGPATPASPQATATPGGGGLPVVWDWFWEQIIKNLADILCIVLPIILAIVLIGLWKLRTHQSIFETAKEVIVDTLKEGPGKAIAKQIQNRADIKSDSEGTGEGAADAGKHPKDEEKLPVKVSKGGKICILFLAADPTNASRLRLGEEIREIQEKLQLSQLRDRFELNQRMSVRPQDISQALLDLKPDIVHFSGHGTESGELCFENPTGEAHPVSPEALAALFGQFSSQIDCVVLNACFSKKQAAAIAKHIDYVIGMKKEIDDRAAIAFAIGFYQGLGGRRTIEEAYNLGCIQIQLQNVPGHLTPILLKKKAG